MHGRRSRTAHPIDTGDPRGLSMGAWGAWQGIIVLATGTAGFATAALYLHSGQPAWPPPEVTAPGVGLAVGSMLLAIAASVAIVVARARCRADARPGTALALITTALLLGASIAVLVIDLQNAGFRWDVHAYASVYWVLTIMTMVYLGVALLMTLATLLMRIVGLVDPDRMLEVDNTVLFTIFAAVAGIGLLFCVHFLPTVTVEDGFGEVQVGPGAER